VDVHKGKGGQAHVDACGHGVKNLDFLVGSFILIEHLYSTSSKKLLRMAPKTSTVKKSSLKVRKKRMSQMDVING